MKSIFKKLHLILLLSLFAVVGCKDNSQPIVEVKLESISLVGNPVTEYLVGDEFIKPTVQANYTNLTTKEVTDDCQFTGFDSTKEGSCTINITYSEKNITKDLSYKVSVSNVSSKLKFAIFADIQLCNDTTISGAANENLGTTANAAAALESHFRFIKENNINVVLMNGDITNQANQYYYNNYGKILKKVYGDDLSKYPEFLWNMGNHEWWWGTSEKETGDAVTLFKNHARISSDNLVAESKVKYSLNSTQTIPSYYKVINGVPFITISAESSAGNVGLDLENEIRDWLEEAKKLQLVISGGPIFVQYHYPLHTSMTHGQAASDTCTTVEKIFENTPNAVVFTGDTHFAGINERSINQVNFTTINLGSSSYSRMVDSSAVVCDDYYNVGGSGLKIDDKLIGNVKFKEAYTPTIQIVEIQTDNTFTIDRYFTDVEGGRKVGEQWKFNKIKSTNDFTYTNSRFENKEAAKNLYGDEGLSWSNDDKLTFGVDVAKKRMTVHFPDVLKHHYVEHYLIDVNGQKYDVVSNYYKYPISREENYYILDNINISESYNVTVTAYDFFDNPSLNILSSSTDDQSKNVETIDYAATLTYTDIQVRNRFDDVTEGSQSCLEYYYKGSYLYNSGAILNRLMSVNPLDGCNNFVSLGDDRDEEPVVKLAVKNLGEGSLTLGMSVVTFEDGKEVWKDDFSATRKQVEGKDWVNLIWNLKDNFGISSKSQIAGIYIKAKSSISSKDGYEMNFLIDNLDLVGKNTPTPDEVFTFVNGQDYNSQISKVTIGETFTMDFQFENQSSSSYINICFFQENWKDYLGYYKVTPLGLGTSYSGVSFNTLDNGYVRVTFNTSLMNKYNEGGSIEKPLTEINFLYIRSAWSTASCNFKINAKNGNPIRGQKFTGGTDFSKDISSIPVSTGSLVIDYKITSGNHFNIMFGDGWNIYFGYYEINDSITSDNYNGIMVTKLNDGYTRLTITFSKLTKSNLADQKPVNISLIYIRGSFTDASGFIEINPAI